jgi:tetratricopeptide (TPR) repeat protein
VQLYSYGRQLQGEKKQDEAFAIFRTSAKKYPDYWLTHVGLARVYSGQGQYDQAIKEMQAALLGVPDETNKSRIVNYVKRLQSKEDINR